MSLGFALGYEPSELDEIEAMVTPLAETLASKVEDMVLPEGVVSQMSLMDIYL